MHETGRHTSAGNRSAGESASKPVLAARNLRKGFPGVLALDGVDFEVRAGEVVALVGENGAGKSTLMKLLAGLHQPDSGEVLLHGEVVRLPTPTAALRRGIALIHQELSLCDNLTVAAALFLGDELLRGPFLRQQAMAEQCRHWLERLGLAVDPNTLVRSLRVGQRQLLEIARALRAEAQVLIMDEPTSSLTQREVERLFEVVRELRSRGVAIVYITHRLAEIEQLADRCIGLRDGHNSGELARSEIDHDRMVQLMVGRDLAGAQRDAHPPGEVALRVRGLCTREHPGHSVDLDVHAGEVVGIAGLLGAGRSELLRAIFGVDTRLAGEVVVAGRALAVGDSRLAIASGLALLPEDRKHEGLVATMSIRENLSLPTLHRQGTWLDRSYERRVADQAIDDLGIACSSKEQTVGLLSGGNQQKVVLGKWLAAKPRVLLLDEPTRGVDVGARAEIYQRLDELAEAGLAVLFVSSELEEVLALSDRVLVLREGEVVGNLRGNDRTEERIMHLATGGPANPQPANQKEQP